MDVKEQAVALRKQGLTYAQISSSLDGALSVDWCKRNLKGVKATDKYTRLYEQALTLSKRQEGVTDKELASLAFEVLGTVEKGTLPN